jgi:lipopolysaccharide export system permease protein
VRKTFDRYVLSKCLVLFVGLFASSVGLFAVVDGFTNLDAFQEQVQTDSTLALLTFMARNYAIRSTWLFDLIGPTLGTMSAVAVLALLVRHGEVNPLLAAGVPTYRLAVPLLAGVLIVQGLLVLNKELVLPRVAVHLTGHHGEDGRDAQEVEPARDRTSEIRISGRELIPATGVLRHAEFLLYPPVLVNDYVAVRAAEAKFFPKAGEEDPAGWQLRNPEPDFASLQLTELGREMIVLQDNGVDVFVVTDVSWDQLHNKGQRFKLLSTPELLRRIRRAAAETPLLRAQLLHAHSRFTRPLLSTIGLFLAIPLIIRRESRSQVTNIAVCMAATASVVALAETGQYLGRAAILEPEAATWIPLILGGGACAWISAHVQT